MIYQLSYRFQCLYPQEHPEEFAGEDGEDEGDEDEEGEGDEEKEAENDTMDVEMEVTDDEAEDEDTFKPPQVDSVNSTSKNRVCLSNHRQSKEKLNSY